MALLITGATGQQGRAVCAAALAAGLPTRALVRRADAPAALALAERDVELVIGDLDDLESLRRALRGVGQVFSMQALDLGQATREIARYRCSRGGRGSWREAFCLLRCAMDRPADWRAAFGQQIRDPPAHCATRLASDRVGTGQFYGKFAASAGAGRRTQRQVDYPGALRFAAALGCSRGRRPGRRLVFPAPRAKHRQSISSLRRAFDAAPASRRDCRLASKTDRVRKAAPLADSVIYGRRPSAHVCVSAARRQFPSSVAALATHQLE